MTNEDKKDVENVETKPTKVEKAEKTKPTPKKTKQPKKQTNKSKANNRMLIDASQTEETRVAVVKNGQLQDFDIESLVRRQIKSNIYLAKVTRVEPSLQAAFVNYGGNRHGFLPFSEIHPDYYRIPVADRERLMAEQEELEKQAAEEAARLAEEEDKKAAEEDNPTAEKSDSKDDENNVEEINDENEVTDAGADAEKSESDEEEASTESEEEVDEDSDTEKSDDDSESKDDNADKKQNGRGGRGGRGRYRRGGRHNKKYSGARNRDDRVSDDDDVTAVEPFWKRIRRAYKIQEVIKRGQIMLIQVNKEERGNKGAAVTSYITLPGRYGVLMPNTPQSGGVSRKISNYKDRKRMREILKDLEVPQGMSVILRTAGTSRTKVEIKRDIDYLMRLWNNIRDLTLKSSAPALINEEGSLIRRSIRDIYNQDIDEVIVSGDRGYKSARDMMKMLMPTHVKKVKQYKDATPLFIKEKIETQIEDMHSQEVHLKSGGYLVINPTEALVSVDVNSGRSTKERNIEDTALRTNIEAAEELARQLRLRDLGGLVVIDFIDMEKRSYNGKVERAMRDALSGDRARIQVGRISSFGLMEMSRQRLQPSLTETHFETCPHCQGMGIVKTVDTVALAILRAIEEEGIARGNSNITVTMENEVALYLLNNRRQSLGDLENRYNLSIIVEIDKVEDESRFTLAVKAKPAEQSDTDDDSAAQTEQQSQDTTPKNNNRRRSNNKKKSEESDVKDTPAKGDKPETVIEETKTEEKPKRGRRKKVEPEKVEIVEVTEETEAKEKPKPKAKKATKPKTKKADDEAVKEVSAPTNDNADENSAAKEAETVNEKPKSKKKGWWNKIVDG